MRHKDAAMLDHFEDFLSSVSHELKRTKEDASTLEQALNSKSAQHETEVRRLYEEMETQIREVCHKFWFVLENFDFRKKRKSPKSKRKKQSKCAKKWKMKCEIVMITFKMLWENIQM